MERIDINNYEAYLLDFSEGSLSSDLQMELELFLIQHPELNIDLNELSLVPLEKDEILFSEKHILKKSVSDLVSETQFICYIENQLPLNDRLTIEKSCASNPSLAKELALYRQTIAKADTSIIYSNKSELKRRSKVLWFNFSATQYAAAACILFLMGLFILWPKPDTNIFKSELAEHSKKSPATNNNTSLHKKETTSERKIAETINITQSIKKQEKLKVKPNTYISPKKFANDSVKQNTNNPGPVKELKSNEPLIVSNTFPVANSSNNKTIVQVITEDEDEPTAANVSQKKKGIWALASKALKNLNKAGVKSVNGNEDENKDKTSYALTLGGINITHKAGSL